MEAFNHAISVSGLGDDIFSAMTQNAQLKVKEKIMNAALNGQTSCAVNPKGITPSFLAQLDQEGISSIQKDDENTVLLFWEW